MKIITDILPINELKTMSAGTFGNLVKSRNVEDALTRKKIIEVVQKRIKR